MAVVQSTKFIVAFPDGWFLRGLVATGQESRATLHDTQEAAHAALVKATTFMGKRAANKARIEQVMIFANEPEAE